MTYRSDRDADLARIAALQRELRFANHEIELLRSPPRPAPATPPAPRPVRIRTREATDGGELIRTYELGRPLSIGRCEEVLRRMHVFFEHPGQVERRGLGARWVGRAQHIELEVTHDAVQMVACDRSTVALAPVAGIAALAVFAAAMVISGVFLILLACVLAAAAYAIIVERPQQFERSRRRFDQIARLVANEPR